MKSLGSLAMLLALVAVALGQPAALDSVPIQTRPVPRGIHPAVVRVIAPENGGMSLGSGTLVAVHGDHGLVVTNWHVVRDATRTIQVVFPDGFRSPASVLKVDRVWDLAALAIWRPNVEPVRLARQPPRAGEPLTIIGYGSGSYRAVVGRCTQYVAPETGQPFEMVELSVAARQGDSGGPILNQRGELAGVLFGSGLGCTSGSYCGRVQLFLASVEGPFDRLAPNPLMIAQRTSPSVSPQPQPSAGTPQADAVPWQPPANYWAVVPPSQPPAAPEGQGPAAAPPVVAAIATQGSTPASPPQAIGRPPVTSGRPSPPPAAALGQVAAQPASGVAAPPGKLPLGNPGPPSETAGPTMAEQLKTILAGIGVFALLFHGLRVLAVTSEPKRKRSRRA